ncbi:MAG: hypothetical protein K0R94_1355 [Burkholderiales bacterium]|jgi:PAS domain S-box-containing protein|nr:hypothetical protein [Burkholderiales bacterium]
MLDFNDPNIYQIIDLVDVSIYWKDKNSRYLGCNKYGLKVLGLNNREDVIGKTDKELLPHGYTARFVELDKLALKNGSYKGEEHGTINNEKRIFLTTKIRLLDNKKQIIIFGTSLDITDMKAQIELEKRNEEVKMKQIIDLINVSIYWKDKDGRYLGCNKYVLDNIFHVKSQEEIIGKTDAELLPKDTISQFMEVDKFALETGYYEGEEYGTVNGKVKTYFASKSRLFDSQNNIIGLVGMSMDITDRKEAEHLKLENQAQKIEIKAQEEFKKCLNDLQHTIQMYKMNILNNKFGVEIKSNNHNHDITLTRREKEVLYFLSINKSPKEIANFLSIRDKKSVVANTIQSIINKQLYTKFKVYNVSQLIEKANLLKLIPFLPDKF